ncbi:translation initiation factor [Planctomicrobium sp. SH664]|uniref:translation initiation factor n=1 Tax=Planctomicrobium sp. SH664 TaxID=3448125 RepID=UPI003F5B2404
MRLFAGTPFDRPPRCERCDQLEAECSCPPPAEQRTPPQKQIARVGLDKRKGNKLITTVRDLKDEGSHLTELLTLLKSRCGAGGSLQAGVLELQGDQRERVVTELSKLGYRVK